MWSLGFTRSLGFALIPLAICCIVANGLLFFPNGEMEYVKNYQLTKYVWYFMGVGGGGFAVLITACIFESMEKIADSHGTESCAMCALRSSVLASLIGLAGSGYCFIISAFAMLEGPYCFTNEGWKYPFTNITPNYLFYPETWSLCTQPDHIVKWNVTLFSILLGLSTIEFFICFLQFISGLVNAVCRPCCYKQQYSLSA